MERLTKHWGNNYVATKLDYCSLLEVPYEDFKCFEAIVKKLADYEDLEEQGRLIKLLCKVGDEIYLVDFEEKTYDVATVMSIEIDTRDNRILLNSDYEVGTWSEDGYVFYSKIEAEKALAEIGE